MNSWISLSIAVFVWVGYVSGVRADHSVAVLGVRSLDGEDELERRIAQGLRTSTDALPGFAVSDRVVSLDQMLLAHGCDEPNEACLNQVAQTLAVELLIFGSVVAHAGEKNGAHDLTLHAFDARIGRTNSAAGRALTTAQLAPAGLPETLTGLLRQTLGLPLTGTLHIEANRPGATISIDGEPRGSADAHGVLELELPPGTYLVRATDPTTPAAGEAPFFDERSVELTLGERQVLLLTLPEPAQEQRPVAAEPKPKRSLRRIFGWVSVGLGAAFAAATVYSWVRIERINDDDDYLAYRRKFPRGEPGADDVCKAASDGLLTQREPESAALERTAKDLCKEADTLEVLQYVFLGGALAGGGTGAYLLLTTPRDEGSRAQLRPRFDGSRALLEASFRF